MVVFGADELDLAFLLCDKVLECCEVGILLLRAVDVDPVGVYMRSAVRVANQMGGGEERTDRMGASGSRSAAGVAAAVAVAVLLAMDEKRKSCSSCDWISLWLNLRRRLVRGGGAGAAEGVPRS